MSDNSAIEWTDTTPVRIRATAAARIGISLEEYDKHRAAGEKWCGGHRAWHAVNEFAVDRSRGDGRVPRCRAWINNRGREEYRPRRRPEPGRRFVEPRSGDQKQARRRVNYLIEAGLLASPNSLACTDCGHEWVPGERRHEYDHHLGYAAKHHEDVESVCTTCHHVREIHRRRAA